MLVRALAFYLLTAVPSTPVLALSLDDELRLIIELYNLRPDTCSVDARLIDEKLIPIGEAVFNTPVLSGDRDTSCSTCHIDDKHLTDGLPVSIGVGGDGEGEHRMKSKGVVVARNAFTLFGRGSTQYKTFFWDGKVQEFEGDIYSPIGEGYSLGFKSALSVAAVLPILARDEFLGRKTLFTSNIHLEQINEAYFNDKLKAANTILSEIINGRNDEDTNQLRKALQNARVKNPDLPLIGNALASFIANKVQNCVPTLWEEYLNGRMEALSDQQKQGAIIFYGKGRCAGCHSGNLFTDFKFHSIGAPQGEFGTHIHGQDIGRAGVTYRVEDRYQFRTPPLIHLSKTAPYGHNGSFETIEETVRFHINPIPFYAEKGWTSEGELLSYGKILSTRSAMLGFISLSDKSDLEALIAFLYSI